MSEPQTEPTTETPAPQPTVDRNEMRKAASAAAQKLAAKDAAKKSPPKKSDEVLFVSAMPESTAYTIKVAGQNIVPVWNDQRTHLTWRVPAALAERFKQHWHVQSGRVIEAK
jgi:hypothetical protein